MYAAKKMVKKVCEFLSIKCNHSSVKNDRCNYCPDCGSKIIIKWVNIKCKQCGHFRKPKKQSFLNLKPIRKFCSYCGSDKWGYQYYYDSNIPDKLRTISVKKIVTEIPDNFEFGSMTSHTNIWVDNNISPLPKRTKNIIKRKFSEN